MITLQIDDSLGDYFLVPTLFIWFMSSSPYLKCSLQCLPESAGKHARVHSASKATQLGVGCFLFLVIRNVHLQSISAFMTRLSSLGNENDRVTSASCTPRAACSELCTRDKRLIFSSGLYQPQKSQPPAAIVEFEP